jgi:hypothetical protein
MDLKNSNFTSEIEVLSTTGPSAHHLLGVETRGVGQPGFMIFYSEKHR